MTEHVRRNYRNHRKATWGFAIALMVAIAAVVIPIASGGFRQDLHDAVPLDRRRHADAAGEREHDEPDAVFGLELHREGGDHEHRQLPTARLRGRHVPRERDALERVVARGSPAAWQISRSGHVVSLRQLSLPKNGVVTITAALGTGGAATAAQAITARVKQSNDFSDSGSNPDANAFQNPTFPTIQVQACTATITGRVYHDRDQSGAFAVNPSSPTSDIAKQGWTVTLQRKTGATTYANVDSDSSDANGMYSVEGPIGSDFRLCVTAPNPPDSSSSWGVRAVPGVTLVDGCAPITPTSDAAKGALRAEPCPARGRPDRTSQSFRSRRRTSAPADTATTDGNYIVTAAGNTTKDPQHYVQETWTDNGHPYFVFAPINACTGCAGKIYLLEQMSGSIKQSDLGPTHQVVLVYDDTEPFTTFTPMPYCLQDPRGAGNTLLDDRRPSGRRNLVHRRRASDGGRRRYGRECIGQLHVHRLHVVRR